MYEHTKPWIHQRPRPVLRLITAEQDRFRVSNMTTGVIRNVLIQGPTPAYYPMFYQHSSSKEDEEEQLRQKPEWRDDEEEREEDEEEDEDCETHEDEEESSDPFLLSPAHSTLDVTNQLLRFADLISRDVQRYFGRCADDREACDIYSDSLSMTTSGCRRYYDDLLRIAGAGSLEEKENGAVSYEDEPGATVAKGNSSLGPLAELFNHRAPSQGQGQPMIKRHLPLSFWTEPIPHCSLDRFSNTPDITHSSTPAQDGEHNSTRQTHSSPLTHQHMNPLSYTEPDFSDLLAYWDPNPEFSHTLMTDAHTQH